MVALDKPDAEARQIEALVGQTLNGKWRVIELVRQDNFQTGRAFSVGYLVEDTGGNRAYAKILDFSKALQEDDTAGALEKMLNSYVFERELLKLCDGYKLTHIIRGLDYGEIVWPSVPLGRFYFIIFKISKEGDVRKYITQNGVGTLSWRIALLQDISVGLRQLHSRNIHHQDLRPSNVLLFGERAKVGDLGRAHCVALKSPHDGFTRPGAFYYAPPEQLYNYPIDNHLEYRLAGEMYLLGSMMDFLITGEPTTVRLVAALADVHRPFSMNLQGWRGFFADVLPHLHNAHASVVKEFERRCEAEVKAAGADSRITAELTDLFRYATNPDPQRRGHPRARHLEHVSDFDLERFVSRFEALAKRLAHSERQVSAVSIARTR